MTTAVNRAGMNAATAQANAAAISSASGQPPQQAHDMPTLSSYIYEHLIRCGHFDTARALLKESNDVQTTGPTKSSPNQRNANGVTDHLDGDSKDNMPKRPDDLPESKAYPLSMGCEKSFLADWWFQFWDVWSAQRNRPNATGQSMQYLHHNMGQNKLRQQTQQQMLQQIDPRMGIQFPQQRVGSVPNGINMPGNLQKAAMANNRNVTPAQMAQMRGANQQQMMANEMKRDGSNIEGQRAPSPTGENAPSPKRPRLEGANGFPSQNAPGNRPGMPGQQPGGNGAGANGQMLLQNGIPSELSAQQQMMGNPNMQMSKETYAHNLAINQGMQASFNMGKGMNPNGPQATPMNQQNAEGMEFSYTARGMPANAGPQSGNHALQDYQMQLMLLEQQNKKRLLMARQEQDSAMSHGGPGGSGPSGPAGFPQGMSPNARQGPSPSPGDQMKRGTPQLKNAGLPGAGSPMPNAENRGSPMPTQVFEPGSMPPGSMPPQLQHQVMMRNGGMMMQPGQPHMGMNMANFNQTQQMEMIRQQNGARLANGMGFPQGGPGMPQGGPGQPQGNPMNPQQRTAMAPPPAPGGAEAQRTNPASPSQQPAAPPTPSTANKANPKKKDAKPKKAGKKAAAGATPAAEPEAATPTPQTPHTPLHAANAFQGKNGAVPPNAGPLVAAAQPAAAQAGAQSGMDPSQNFGLEGGDGFDVPFSMDNDGPLLDNFDFDSFLQTDGADGAFDLNAFNEFELEATE